MSGSKIATNIIFPPLKDVMQKVAAAVVNLYRLDYNLLDVDANERSIAHKFAEHFQKEFPDWHVDCEYNRLGKDKKKLFEKFSPDFRRESSVPDDTEGSTVFPDIIVHKRKMPNNLLVMEIKKGNGADSQMDIQKLREFGRSKEYRYRYGMFLRLGEKGCSEVRFFEEWREVEEQGRLLRELIDKELEGQEYGG